jgi:thiosulfate dehydrogenase (quinone) large subunit
MIEASRARQWLVSSVAPYAVAFLAFRLTVGWLWAWGWFNKAPWNDFGCHPTTQICLRGFLTTIAPYQPFNGGSFITGVLLPNYATFGWFQFVVELLLSVTIIFGIFTRIAAVGAVLWGLVVAVPTMFVPWVAVPEEVLFLMAQVLLLATRNAAVPSVDMFLRPRFRASSHRLLRLLGRLCY